ncbi:MAG: signal recognition particle subunit SRP19/SEC65 family protein [Nitrosopumilus sp.]|nr:signal recognition particle subunit SRP19/SEC65 family protein [Nitrosopumilus sp.]CAI9831842.1 Signal recognition particle, subunit SRP19 (SRP19) [Nitrosopumilaceae archaeon]MDA7941656.1 signal recognition particle subunit SRP19/SEC65 family protein [Nitrosopumilus sp.]MDA7943769.1 signal recognition particle subunit SRP19/SEC65 family protein [Nitrosopumilus sp.]MDA7945133.1 signal recognition particle subunit SRP19/SEC65 family protein [Nitrosopumilus sp.]
MKDYDHVVVWLDYFNKNLKRSKGRRLPLEKCVHDPSLKELGEAARRAGLEVSASDEKPRHPRRPFVRSGNVSIPRDGPKSGILARISAELVAARAKKRK